MLKTTFSSICFNTACQNELTSNGSFAAASSKAMNLSKYHDTSLLYYMGDLFLHFVCNSLSFWEFLNQTKLLFIILPQFCSPNITSPSDESVDHRGFWFPGPPRLQAMLWLNGGKRKTVLWSWSLWIWFVSLVAFAVG